MEKLKIFVGSSTEAKEHDVSIRKILEEYDIDPIAWGDIFHPGEFGLESLLKITNDVDGAILIATTDDKTWYRGHEGLSPRDNILFETGLFIKSLGRLKAVIVLVKDKSGKIAKIPTDLIGLNLIVYDVNKPANNERLISKWIIHLQSLRRRMDLSFDDSLNILKNNYHRIPESWKDEIKDYIITPFKRISVDALRGEFTLTPGQYYNSVISELNMSKKETIIRAISLLPSVVWEKDPHQLKFMDINIDAKTRGARIKRIFVCKKDQITDLSVVIKKQLDQDIEIKLLDPRLFAEYNILDDFIIFAHNEELKSFVSLQYYDNPQRLRGGRLILNHTYILEQINAFEQAWKVAIDPSPLTIKELKQEVLPPGNRLTSYKLSKPVISCEEAAKERKIPLKHELKTLVLSTKTGFVAVHLPGDGNLSLRSVKNALETKEACLADPEELGKLKLSAGTVSAILDPVWSMPHLISRRLFALDYVMCKSQVNFFGK